jgi:hypothetical protein
MTDLRSIPGIGRAAFELLEAAGFPDAESLAKAGVEELAKELERANRILQIAKRSPTRGNVKKWIASAQDLVGGPQDTQHEVEMPVNYETTPNVASLLAIAPLAIPLPAKILIEQHLAVGDIPPAILLNRYSGDLEVRVEDRVPSQKYERHGSSQNIHLAEISGTRRDIDVSRIKSTDVLAGPVVKSATAKTNDNDRVALIRGPREETNQGRDPQSRFFIRGVMHSHPVSMGVGAVATVLLGVLLPVGIVSSLLLLLSREVPKYFGWVPEWLLVLPLSLPVFGVIYLIWGLQGGCRICGQKLFIPRMCLKNSKAHHFPGLGHIIPVCFHMLVFKWFRCTYCGTPVRLKK